MHVKLVMIVLNIKHVPLLALLVMLTILNGVKKNKITMTKISLKACVLQVMNAIICPQNLVKELGQPTLIVIGELRVTALPMLTVHKVKFACK